MNFDPKSDFCLSAVINTPYISNGDFHFRPTGFTMVQQFVQVRRPVPIELMARWKYCLQETADVLDFLRVHAVRHGVGVPLHRVAHRLQRVA